MKLWSAASARRGEPKCMTTIADITGRTRGCCVRFGEATWGCGAGLQSTVHQALMDRVCQRSDFRWDGEPQRMQSACPAAICGSVLGRGGREAGPPLGPPVRPSPRQRRGPGRGGRARSKPAGWPLMDSKVTTGLWALGLSSLSDWALWAHGLLHSGRARQKRTTKLTTGGGSLVCRDILWERPHKPEESSP